MGFMESYKKASAEQRQLEQSNGRPGLVGWFRELPLIQKVTAVVVLLSMLAAVIGILIADYIA